MPITYEGSDKDPKTATPTEAEQPEPGHTAGPYDQHEGHDPGAEDDTDGVKTEGPFGHLVHEVEDEFDRATGRDPKPDDAAAPAAKTPTVVVKAADTPTEPDPAPKAPPAK